VSLAQPAAADPLFEGLPGTVPAHATHLQTVLAPPPGATVLARSALDDCQAFRWGENTWGVQFHPEFSTGMMRGYIQARAEALAREGHCHRTLLQAVRPAPLARRVLRRFVHHARRRAHPGAPAE
jgi:GMP synthase (glutamine-hydrolysing)